MIRRLACLVAALTAIGVVLACRGATSRSSSELALGGQAYLAQCSVCHGVEGQGDGPLVASIVAEQRPQPARFTAEKMRSLGRSGVARVLEGESHRQPHAPMPFWGPHLGHEWTNRIADYVVHMPSMDDSGRAAVARYLGAPAGASATGRRTYVTYCSACHGPQGHGETFFAPVPGMVPPPLQAEELRAFTDDEFAKFLAPGGQHMEHAPSVPGWLYTISPAERADLIQYIRTLAP